MHITDTGYLSSSVLDKINNKHTYIMESNYEDELIMTNPNYPFYTKQRIMSDRGHLSNIDCNRYLKEITGSNTKNIFFAHLSVQNNQHDLVLKHNESLCVDNKFILSKDQIHTFELGEI